MRGNKCLDVSSSDEDERNSSHVQKSPPAPPPSSKTAGEGRVRKKPPVVEANGKLKKKKKMVMKKEELEVPTISTPKKTPERVQKTEAGIKQEQKSSSVAKVKHDIKCETPVKREVKKERVIYDLPGQTKATPPETDPLRRFYTSLLEENSDSKMARKWCIQHGLLKKDEAEQWCLSNSTKSRLSGSKVTPKAKRRRTQTTSGRCRIGGTKRAKRDREQRQLSSG